MRERLLQFMDGRYGIDHLNKSLSKISVVCLVFSLLFHTLFWYLIALLALGYSYFRMFSRDIPKRYEEDQKFLKLRYHLIVRWNRYVERARKKISHRVYVCPECGQKVRVPRGKGKIEITCPKCSNTFVKRT